MHFTPRLSTSLALLLGSIAALHVPSDARADFVTQLDCRYTIHNPQPLGDVQDEIANVPCPPYTNTSPFITADMRAYFGQIGVPDDKLTDAQKKVRAAAAACCNTAVGGVWCGAQADIVLVYKAFQTPAKPAAKLSLSNSSTSYVSTSTFTTDSTVSFNAIGTSTAVYNGSNATQCPAPVATPTTTTITAPTFAPLH